MREKFLSRVDITLLEFDEYCVINDPHNKDGQNQVGKQELRVGPLAYFLKPGESTEGVKPVFILSNE